MLDGVLFLSAPVTGRAAVWFAQLSRSGERLPHFFICIHREVEVNQSSLAQELERRVEEAGFEVVELERSGDERRPILRLRIDRPDSIPGKPGVSLDDCTALSRVLEPYLDAREDLSDRYVLEVSSPGVERPLVRRRDWQRFAGEMVVVRGRGLAGPDGRLEGMLLGLREQAGGDFVGLRLHDGEEVEISLADVTKAHLRYQWKKPERPR